MIFVLANQINWEVVISAIGLFLTTLVSVGGTLWKGGSMICHWLAGKLGPIFEGHKQMVETLNVEMPKVSQAMGELQKTQLLQCKQLDAHSELLTEHKSLLGDIHTMLKRSNGDVPTAQEG